jgi:hypothetical protein
VSIALLSGGRPTFISSASSATDLIGGASQQTLSCPYVTDIIIEAVYLVPSQFIAGASERGTTNLQEKVLLKRLRRIEKVIQQLASLVQIEISIRICCVRTQCLMKQPSVKSECISIRKKRGDEIYAKTNNFSRSEEIITRGKCAFTV